MPAWWVRQSLLSQEHRQNVLTHHLEIWPEVFAAIEMQLPRIAEGQKFLSVPKRPFEAIGSKNVLDLLHGYIPIAMTSTRTHHVPLFQSVSTDESSVNFSCHDLTCDILAGLFDIYAVVNDVEYLSSFALSERTKSIPLKLSLWRQLNLSQKIQYLKVLNQSRQLCSVGPDKALTTFIFDLSSSVESSRPLEAVKAFNEIFTLISRLDPMFFLSEQVERLTLGASFQEFNAIQASQMAVCFDSKFLASAVEFEQSFWGPVFVARTSQSSYWQRMIHFWQRQILLLGKEESFIPWAFLGELPVGITKLSSQYYVCTRQLFIDFSLRRALPLSHRLALPTDLSELTRYCHFQGDIRGHYQRFLGEISANRHLFPLIQAAVASLRDQTQSGDVTLSVTRNPVGVKNPDPQIEKRIESNIESKIEEKGVLSTSILPSAEDFQATEGGQLSKMKLVAQQTLSQMQAVDRTSYHQLYERYLNSLTESERLLMLDFQRRMRPHIFESQLQTRLVNYMIQHPSEWTSRSMLMQ